MLILILRCVIIIVIVVGDTDTDTDTDNIEYISNETVNIYEEMLQIIKHNELQYDRFRSTQEYEPQIQSKYTTSLPIPIPNT
jgi:UDP-glucose 6-dehydrogenase